MKRIVIYLLANAAALYLIVEILKPSFIITGGVKGYLIAALIIGLVNALVKPILKLLSLPLLIMTLGLFSIVLNMLMLFLAKYLLNVFAFEGVTMEITGAFTYFWIALLLSVANVVIHKLAR